MIPILYEGDVTDFNNNGLGRLSDAIKCTVEEERNGTFELEMTYPISGIHYSDIAVNRIIFAKTEDGGNNQAFIIYKISKPINGIVTINAEHISYLLNGYVVMPFNAVSLADAMSKINTYAVLPTGFIFSTDIINSKSFELDEPRCIRNLLGGQSGSLLDVYGGHDYRFDNFSVQLLADRGQDNGVTIRYGKNLTDLKAVSNATNIYTGIVPYWTDNEGHYVYVNNYVVYSEHATTYPYKYIKIVDFSSDFEAEPSQAQLLARAESYLENNDGWQIKNNIEVSFVSLAQTAEYKDIAPLERVKLCDTVKVEYTKLGISFKTKVIKTVYNVLLNRYDSIELGDTTYTLAQALQQTNDTPTMAETTSAIQRAVNNATNLIRGGLGGHVVMVADGNGLPQEILIMDTEDITTAQKVWRWNLNGLGYSSTGYDGTYGTAITMDGQIVANYITAGTFNGALIQAGTISAEALSVEAKESLQSIHNYLGDVFNDISLWRYVGTAPYYEIVGDKTYLVIDGNNAGSADRVFTPIDLSGNVTLNIHFKYHIDTAITISQQRFPFINYTKTSGGTYFNWKNISAQDIPADTDFVWDVTLTPTDIDPTKPAYFGFYRFDGCKIYVEELTVQTTVDSYAEAAFNFNSNGLQLLAEKVDKNSQHDYLPFDIWDNISRIHSSYSNIVDPYYEVVSGVKYIVLDGAGLTTFSVSQNAYINSDYIEYPTFNVKLVVKFDTAFTVTDSDFKLIYFDYKDGGGVTRWEPYILMPQGTSYQADREYTFEDELSVVYAAKNDQSIRICYIPSVKMYIKTIEITSTEENYKKTTLSITADGLDSVVQAGSIISTINQSAEQVSINASKINLTGDLSLRGQFQAFDPNDNTNYIDMTNGAIKVVNQSDVKFVVSCEEYIAGAGAGVYFGDLEDPATMSRYSSMTFDMVRTPYLYIREDGSHDSGGTPPQGAAMRCEGDAYFYGDLHCSHYDASDPTKVTGCVSAAYFYTPINSRWQNEIYNNTKFYGDVYNSSGGTVFVSDRRKKRSIKDLVIEKARSFIMSLKPREFKFIEQISKSDRKHHGFIAQEVKGAMHEDWGVYCEDKEHDFIGLRYDELIADMVAVIQDQEKRINALERAINDKSNN